MLVVIISLLDIWRKYIVLFGFGLSLKCLTGFGSGFGSIVAAGRGLMGNAISRADLRLLA